MKNVLKNKWLWVATTAVIVIPSIFFANNYVNDRKRVETRKVVRELDAYKAAQPNYEDSIALFNAQNSATMDALQQEVDSLEKIYNRKGKDFPEYKAARDAQRAKRDSLNELYYQKMQVNNRLERHLDSVKKANAGKWYIRAAALEYTK